MTVNFSIFSSIAMLCYSHAFFEFPSISIPFHPSIGYRDAVDIHRLRVEKTTAIRKYIMRSLAHKPSYLQFARAVKYSYLPI